MKELFRDADFTRVGLCQSILEAEGIPTHIRNQDLVGIMTEVPIPEFFPALCVVDDGDYDRAITLLRDRMRSERERSRAGDRTCAGCDEPSPGNFEVCWNCGREFEAEG